MKSKTKFRPTHLTALLTSAAVAAGSFPVLSFPAVAADAQVSVSLTKDEKSYGDGWYWDGEMLELYGANISVPKNSAYFGEFAGFSGQDTINVIATGQNAVTLADGASFIDSGSLSLSVDGSAWLDVSGSGALFSGGSVAYSGGLVNAQGAVTVFDAQSAEISYCQVKVPDGAVASGGSLTIKHANLKAGTVGADSVTAEQSFIELTDDGFTSGTMTLINSVAELEGTDFGTAIFDLDSSVAVFTDVAFADSVTLNVATNFGKYETKTGHTVFCSEFLSSDNFSQYDGSKYVDLSSGTHSGIYYDGEYTVIASDGVTLKGGNYFTAQNRSVIGLGTNFTSAATEMYIEDAAVVGISTAKGKDEFENLLGTVTVCDCTMTNSSLFGSSLDNQRNVYLYDVTLDEEKTGSVISTCDDANCSDKVNMIIIKKVNSKNGEAVYSWTTVSNSYVLIYADRVTSSGRATAGRLGLCSNNKQAIVDGNLTSAEKDYTSNSTSIYIRNGRMWAGQAELYLQYNEVNYNHVYVHNDKIKEVYIHSAPNGSDKYADYVTRSQNKDDKLYIGPAVLPPSVYIVPQKKVTITADKPAEYDCYIYNCKSDAVVEWLDENGSPTAAPFGVDTKLLAIATDEKYTKRKLKITVTEDAFPGNVWFMLRSGDAVSDIVTAEIADSATVVKDFMMDFRDSTFRKEWAFGATFTDPSENYTGTRWRWYGQDTTENGLTYKAKTLVLEDGFYFNTTYYIGIGLPDGATLITEGRCRINANYKPIKCEGSLVICSGGTERSSMLLTYNQAESGRVTAAAENEDKFHGGITTGVVETAGDLTVSGCDISVMKLFTVTVSTGSFVESGGNITLSDMSLNTSSGSNVMKGQSAVKCGGRLLIKTGVELDVIPSSLWFAELKTVQLSELSELTDTTGGAVYTAENFGTLQGSAGNYTLSPGSSRLQLVTKPITVDNTVDGLWFCKDSYGKQSGTVRLSDLGAVSGGSGSYAFTADGTLPQQFTLNGDTLEYDLENEDMVQTSVTFIVTDADNELAVPGESVELTLNFGPVAKAYYVSCYKPEHGNISVTPVGGRKTTESSDATGKVLCVTPFLYNEEAVVTVAPDRGYQVKSAKLDDTEVALVDGKYTFTVTADCTFAVEFEEIPVARYTVTVDCGKNGTVTPGTSVYEDGTAVTLTVTPDSGYRVKSAKLDGAEVALVDGKYTFTVTADCTFAVEFEEIPVARYTVTVDCGKNGTVTPGTSVYEDGTAVTLTVTPDSGYRVKSAKLDGAEVALVDGKYTFTVTADCTFAVEFEEIPVARYTVTVDCGKNGTVTPGTSVYEDGTEVTLTVTPDSGYRVKSAKLDGATVALVDGKYTFTVTADCTFAVELEEIPVARYTVIVDCGKNGTVTPGTSVYEDGTAVTLTVTPDSGYCVKSAKLNGAKVALVDGKYTFTVTADCTFAVEFEKITGGSGGSGSSGGSRDNTGRSTLPKINGIEKSWREIAEDIARLSGGTVIINLNGETVVPVEVIKSIADSKAKAEFIVDSARGWLVDGSDISTVSAADFSLLPSTADRSGLRGTNGAAVIVRGTKIPAGLKLTFRKEFAGQYANLYKMTEGKLTFQNCFKVDESGAAAVCGVYFEGEYVVMVSRFSDLPGDMNNDGAVNALDSSAILESIVCSEAGVNPLMADFNSDGVVNALDASAILKKVVQ